MALVIINRNSSESHYLTSLKKALIDAQNYAEQIQLQNSNADSADTEIVFGVNSDDVAVFKTTINDVVTVLDDSAIQNYIGNIA